MKQSDHFRENAENCARLAEAATNEPLHLRYKQWKQPGSLWPTSRIGLIAKCRQ
jgi:hypothetical protein